jgi:hypothetical protein
MAKKTAPKAAYEKWSDISIRALAEWWGNQLPGRTQQEEIKGMPSPADMTNALIVESHNRAKTPDETYEAFVNALTDIIKNEVNRTNNFNGSDLAHLTLRTDYGPDKHLEKALIKAGLGDNEFVLPMRKEIVLHEDGRIFVIEKSKPVVLNYEGAPNLEYVSFQDLEFQENLYFREEKRYLVANLEPGQEFYAIITYSDGKRGFLPQVADDRPGHEDVLVIPEDGATNFETLTLEDVRDLKNCLTVTSASGHDMSSFKEGGSLVADKAREIFLAF